MNEALSSLTALVSRNALAALAWSATAAQGAWRSAAAFESRLNARVDRFVTTGWRKAFGWLALAVAAFSFLYAPLNGIAVDYAAVNVFLTMATGMYVARGVEKHQRDRINLELAQAPGGGLVNQAALQ